MRNLPLSLAVAAAAGAFTLLRPADWSAGARRAYVAVPGAVIGALTAAALSTPGPTAAQGTGAAGAKLPGRKRAADGGSAEAAPLLPVPARAGLAVAAGAAISGVQAVSLSIDEGTEAWLIRRGVAHPRAWMSAAVALCSLVLDRLADARDTGDAEASR